MHRGDALAERLRRLLPGVWLGWLLCVALLATPAAFATLPRAEAGRVVAPMLAQEAYTSLAAAVLLLIVERMLDKRRGRAFGLGFGLVLGTLFCTVAGYFGVQPLMDPARAGQGPLGLGALHAISVGFFAVKLVLVAVLAWRASATGG